MGTGMCPLRWGGEGVGWLGVSAHAVLPALPATRHGILLVFSPLAQLIARHLCLLTPHTPHASLAAHLTTSHCPPPLTCPHLSSSHTRQAFLRNFAKGRAPPATGAADAQANAITRAALLAVGWAGAPTPFAAAPTLHPTGAGGVAGCGDGGGGACLLHGVGEGGLAAAVRRATRVTQNSDVAVAWALAGVGVMERLVTGACLPTAAVSAVAREVETAGSR